jgi:hypothetical protein
VVLESLSSAEQVHFVQPAGHHITGLDDGALESMWRLNYRAPESTTG